MLHPQVDPLAAVFQVAVADENPGQQARFAKYLETVAYPYYQAASGCETLDRRNDRGETGDGAGPQVVTVREAAGQHYAAIPVGKVRRFLMPEVVGLLVKHSFDGVKAIAVAPGAREHNYAEAHCRPNQNPGRNRGWVIGLWTGETLCGSICFRGMAVEREPKGLSQRRFPWSAGPPAPIMPSASAARCLWMT
jgi:hypothetical protein